MKNKVVTPVDVTIELMAGIVMALTIVVSLHTASGGGVSALTIALSTVGCNLAWGIFDGVIYVFNARALRAYRQNLIEKLQKATDPEAIRQILGQELKAPVSGIGRLAKTQELHDALAAYHAPVLKDQSDWLGALAVGTAAVGSTAPVIIPFIFISGPQVAVAMAGCLGMAAMSWAGIRVARWNGQSIWLLGIVTPLVGALFVATCLLLGG